jgi:phosphatidylinositol phospholipase C delta
MASLSTQSLHASLDLNGDPLASRSPKPQYTRMTSAITIPKARVSPATTTTYFGFNGAASLQSTPEGIVPVSHSSLPAPTSLYLPESLLQPPNATPPTSTPSAMAEALAKSSGGLIRRVSRGARQGFPNKFRRNGSNAHRDKSSGPVIMRRRSDSRTAVDNALDMSDLDLNLDVDEEEAIEDFGEPINALGISSNRPSVSSIPDSAVVAPVRNPRLEQGTRFRKVTKKETKQITLRLDLHHAKVYWDPSRPSKAFYIDDVKEIRSGPEARHYREECKYSENYEPLWFTIVYLDTTRSKGKIKSMHLIADDMDTIKLWTQTLDKVSRNRTDMMAGLLGFSEKSAKLVWQREMSKRSKGPGHLVDETLDLPGIIRLFRSLHINCSNDMFRFYFDQADSHRTGKLDQDQFLSFVRWLRERNDIREIYKQFVSKERPEMDKDTFFAFLKREQGVDAQADPDYWTAVFEKSARASKPKSTPLENGQIALPLTMDFAAFQTFLTSSANSCYVPPSVQVRHDRPLNEYFISSSHNTYLTGRQVIGESSTEAYIIALQKGCRCLEIDCWNGNDKQPIVNHGRTLTTSISFRDTIKVINQYAFCESPYPLILSLEVHCDREQQARMADIMKQEFGEKLVQQPIDWDSTVLPTPEELKGRILIKVKAAGDDLDAKGATSELPGRTRERSMSSPWSRPIYLDNTVIPNSPLLSSPTSMSPPERTTSFWATPRTSTTSTNPTIPSPAMLSSADDSDSPQATDTEKKKKKSTTSKIIPVLGDFGVYTKGVKFTNFKTPEASTYNHVFSIAERTFKKLTEPDSNSKRPLEEHNMRHLMRVYPSFHRVTSTNFEPLSYWRRGVQMAALNWQTYDLGQQLNEAMFTGGDDRSGYVLKPAELRLDKPTPVLGHKRAPKKLVKFAVEIISAQQLPRPKGLSPDANINPYIEFEMHCAEDMGRNATGEGGQDASARNGLSGIGEPIRKRTRIVPGNGYNPVFKDKISMTLTTRYPSLVFVRWTVWNSRDAQNTERAPLATFTAKLSSLQQGYRHLPLFNSNGEQYLFSTLFCKIEKEDSIDVPGHMLADHFGLGTSSVDYTGAMDTNQQSGRSFLRKLIHRTPSGSKRRTKDNSLERTYSDPKDSGPDAVSRHSSTSTFERSGS